MSVTPANFFTLENTPLAALFDGCSYVWEGLPRLKPYLADCLQPNVGKVSRARPLIERTVILFQGRLVTEGFEITSIATAPGFVVSIDGATAPGASIIYAGAALFDETISIGESSVIEPGALIKGPTRIGNRTEVRQGAYIRGEVATGDGCVIGHATEVKSSILLGSSKAGHFAYIGNSILGSVNLGAGTKLANLKIVPSGVTLTIGGTAYTTGLRKLGAIIADGAEIGCNAVTMPGTLIGRDALVYPNTVVRGYCPPRSILKLKQQHDIIEKKA